MTRIRCKIACLVVTLGLGLAARTLRAQEPTQQGAPVIAPALNMPRTTQEPALGQDRLHIDAQAQIRLDEGKLLVQAEYDLSANEPGAINLDLAPLVLPLLAPVVAGNVLDSGTIPAAGLAVEAEADGVAVARQAGALQIRGTVRQGEKSVVRVRYLIAYQAPRITLGITGRGAETWLSLAVVAVAPARVRLAVDRPAKLSHFEQGSERLVGAGLARPLLTGEVASFVIADLPEAPRVVRKSLVLLVMLMAIGAAGLLWSHRAAEPPPPDVLAPGDDAPDGGEA